MHCRVGALSQYYLRVSSGIPRQQSSFPGRLPIGQWTSLTGDGPRWRMTLPVGTLSCSAWAAAEPRDVSSMIEFEVSVEGPFLEQHTLVKIGSVVASLSIVLLGNYIPMSLIVWLTLIGRNNPAQPQPPLWGWLFVGGVLFGMIAVGSYGIGSIVSWCTGGRLDTRQLGAVIGSICLISAAVAVTAVTLELWDFFLLGALVATFFSAVLGVPIIGVGQALKKRHQKS